MTFHIYSIQQEQYPHTLINTGNGFSIAGNNLLRKAWISRGSPVNTGWNVSADELIQILTDGKESYNTLRLIIDYYPSNMERIPLIEVLEVFVFNWGTLNPLCVEWTPLMFLMRDVWDFWSEKVLNPEERDKIKSKIVSPPYSDEFVEFLYLKGDEGGWNWGRNGATNASFIHGAARDYFRQYF